MDDQRGEHRSPRFSAGTKPLIAWLIVSALVAGFFFGRIADAGPAASAAATEPDATATRTAELAELEALQTQVAQASTPCAAPTQPVATPTEVPAGEMGQEYPYAGGWTVVVKDVIPVRATADAKPQGMFLQVNFTLTNNNSSAMTFPFRDLVLVDSGNRSFVLSQNGSTLILGPSWYLGIDPSLPTDQAVIFDVAPDAGTSFVLESTADPTFRVNVQIIQRG
jgi:hypothetical protein